MKEPYGSVTRPDTPPIKFDAGEEYGEVIASRDSLAVRKTGNVFSFWFENRMLFTSTNELAVSSFVEGLRGL